MISVVDSLNLIGQTMDSILDFLAQDEELSQDFQKYLEINEIEIETPKQFNNFVIEYILDMKMQSGLRVLEYFRRNNKSYDEIINALLNSFVSIFKVNKILSNGFETTCITSEKDVTLIPMVKMNHLKQIGRFDYIEARIVELNGAYFILEVHDVISEHDVFKATTEGIKHLIQDSRCAYFKNEEKRKILEKSAEEFYEKMKECFGLEENCNFITTTNKKVDELIKYFNEFRLDGKKKDYSNLIEKVEKNRFLEIKELNSSESDFLENAIGGFSSHKETYDVALWIDKKRGFYVIPFFETFLKCFKEEIEGKEACIREFLTSDKIPPSVIKYALEENENFFEEINKVLNTDFSTLEELLFNTKSAFIENGIFSPTTVLFNSELFSNLLEITKSDNSF